MLTGFNRFLNKRKMQNQNPSQRSKLSSFLNNKTNRDAFLNKAYKDINFNLVFTQNAYNILNQSLNQNVMFNNNVINQQNNIINIS